MGFSRQEYWSGISFNWHCHFLLQGTFPTQGLNPHLLLGRRTLYHRIRHHVIRQFAGERVLKSPNLTCALALSHLARAGAPAAG